MSKLSDEFYKPLESVIVNSRFWTYDNGSFDPDYNVVYGEDVDQTPAAEVLGTALRDYFREIGYPIVFVVRSPDVEVEANKNYIIGPSHRYYPNRIVLGGEMGMNSRGVLIMYLNLGIFDEDFDIKDIKPATVAAKLASVIRHEVIHAKQYDKRAKSQKITRAQAKKKYEEDGSIADSSDRQAYLSSHIEIDAYAHEFAENLLRDHGKKVALDILRKSSEVSDFAIPEQMQEYFSGVGGQEALERMRGKVYKHIIDMHDRKLFESIIKRLLALG
jgi:hypothetical protein